MKSVFAVLTLACALSASAQPDPHRYPFPPSYPFPGGTQPDPFPQDLCMGEDYRRVIGMVREKCEAKAESWGAEKGVSCSVKKVELYSCRATCVNAEGANFARLTMSFDTTCGMRWGNSTRLYKTKILYY